MRLDLSDIQGNILKGYRLPTARYIYLNFTTTEAARALLDRIYLTVTNAEIWVDGKPSSTLNVALSRTALPVLGVPGATIEGMPGEFLDGMAKRASILGDTGKSAPVYWDHLWMTRVDAMISINAISADALQQRYRWLETQIKETGGGEILDSQDAGALHDRDDYFKTEHFGYTDGISQPKFDGSLASHKPGDGKVAKNGGWETIATGEFLLGYPNESEELPPYPHPPIFANNGTFMVFRKLRQNVAAFRQYFDELSKQYPEGLDKLRAKFIGRWTDGTPLAASPDRPDPAISGDSKRVNDFTYGDDPDGLKCPIGSHLRRVNPRDSMGFDGDLTRMRRIVRRGLPYGPWVAPNQPVDDQERGIIFMALNASISRQFEFVQQQWVNYANDMRLGEEKDPVIGNHDGDGCYVIPGDVANGYEPFVCADLPSFVETCGGDYFFVPSITTLRMIAHGLVDPR